jgi:hypothetical protein
MAANEYHLVSKWRVRGSVADVFAILANFSEMPRWWPEGFLSVRRTSTGSGLTLDVHSRGFLPYTLRWTARLTAVEAPGTFTIAVEGDFDGHSEWDLRQDGEWVEVTFTWVIRVLKPLVRRLSWLLRPVFVLNHRWAMAKGEQGLQRELDRTGRLPVEFSSAQAAA